ncbi:MAG: hypothetical protein WCO84_00330 [bacterium]
MEKIESQQKHKESIKISEKADYKEVLDGAEKIANIEKIPQGHFELIDIDKETELFYSFMKRGRFSSAFDKMYPGLRVIQEECKDKDECTKRYRKFLEDLRITKEEEMLVAREQIESEWKKIEVVFLKTLSEHFETEWPGDKPNIVGYVSNLPIFPRFLDNYQFCVGYKKISDSIETSAHEIVHFLWFKKWKEVFPEIERKEYEVPHLAWRLSEIMDPIILQCHPKIKEIIKPKRWGYTSFESIKIGDVGMVDFFKKIYLDCINSGDNFETILKKLWDEAKKHEKEISVF